MSLVARHLEANGIPTVIIGTARDIVEYCGVPRFLYVDFPLGSPCGEPWDAEQQRTIVGMGLDLLEQATGPRTTWEAPFKWSNGDDWKNTVFTQDQPFLTGEAYDRWLAKKQRYRDTKATGA